MGAYRMLVWKERSAAFMGSSVASPFIVSGRILRIVLNRAREALRAANRWGGAPTKTGKILWRLDLYCET
jgi:hypothetical protein